MKFAIKLNTNSYYPLCSDFIDIMTSDDSLDSLEAIDSFTAKFSRDEIEESIKRSNVLTENHFNYKANDNESFFDLVIIYNESGKIRELKVYTKDDLKYLEFDVMTYISNNWYEVSFINQVYNFISNKSYLSQEIQDFSFLLRYSHDLSKISLAYTNLNYNDKRFLKTYLYKIEEKKSNKNQLKLKNE